MGRWFGVVTLSAVVTLGCGSDGSDGSGASGATAGAAGSAGSAGAAGTAGSGGAGGTAGGTAGTGGEPWVEARSTVLYGPLGESDVELYPSNRYAVADSSTETGLRLNINTDTVRSDSLLFGYGPSIEQLNAMDGFSPIGGITVKFSTPIDPAGIASSVNGAAPESAALDAAAYTRPGAPMMLLDVDESSPRRGETVGLVPVYSTQLADSFWLTDDHTLIVHPARALDPGTRYVFVITTDVKADDGSAVGRSEHMHALLTGAESDAYASQLLADVAEVEEKFGIERSQIAGATSFTTAHVQRELVATAAARRASATPAVTEAWSVGQEDDRRVRFVNRYPAPELRRAKPNGKWDVDADGVAQPQQTENLEFFMTFSDKTQSGPRPVVLYGHGLGGDKDGEWGTAGRLNGVDDRGVVVFSVDSPEHGARRDGPTTLINSVYAFFGIDDDGDFDIGRARDNFRQMAMDQLQLIRLIQALGELDVLPVGAPDGVPDLDVSRILYIGHSFGSVQGPTIAALAPEIHAATWNVGGAGLMMLLRDSNTFSLVVSSLAPKGTPFGAIASFMAITQLIVDPGDAVNYARYVGLEPLPGVSGWTPRDMLLQEVVNDGIVPNSTSEAMARSAGLGLLREVQDISGLEPLTGPLSANLPSGATGVITQFDRLPDGSAIDHGGLVFEDIAIQQYVEFFSTSLANGHATVRDPYQN